MHFSGSCKRDDVCLFDNTWKSVTGWDLNSTKNAGFPISTTDCTYAFCTSGIFLYWRLKETSKKKKKTLEKVSGLVVWPDPDWSPSLISSWHPERWLLISDFLEDLWLYSFHFFSSHQCYPLFLLFLSGIVFPEVGECHSLIFCLSRQQP